MWHRAVASSGFLAAGGYLEPGSHFEGPESKRRIKNLVDVSGMMSSLALVEPRPATLSQLERFHTASYLQVVQRLSDQYGGDTGEGALMSKGGFEIASLGVGAAISAVDEVMSSRVQNAYALTRPPGHHALADRGMGFCIFNNGVLAALHARLIHEVDRIAFVDWDVHHGNGTEHAFWDDPNTLTISVRQDRLYPLGSGLLEHRGGGAGLGYNLNVPLPAGSGHEAYLDTIHRVVEPALHRFQPDLIIVACGFDAGAYDPLGRQLLHSESFRLLARSMMESSVRLCSGRLVLLHEGGYCPATVPFMALAVLEEISGQETSVQDPFLREMQQIAGQSLQSHQGQIIDSAEQHMRDIR